MIKQGKLKLVINKLTLAYPVNSVAFIKKIITSGKILKAQFGSNYPTKTAIRVLFRNLIVNITEGP